MKQRLGDHKRSLRFKNDSFSYKILEESSNRAAIEKLEEYWINELNTYNNGLNKSKSGKGYGHNSSNFTTLGYIFSKESRKKMSESAKARAINEGFDVRSKSSKKGWEIGGEEYRKHMSNIRKGKRLRQPKISDQQVLEIRKLWEIEKHICENEISLYNKEAKKLGRILKTPHGHFSSKYAKQFNCSTTTIKNIILWKTRTKVLPYINDKCLKDKTDL